MKIIAIIVLYNDDNNQTLTVVSNIALQVDEVCLIDNSLTSCKNTFSAIENIIYLPQYHNIGIAAAQNVGIRYAMERGFDYVLFSDPDSLIPGDAAKTLLHTKLLLDDRSINVGAVGSVAYNYQTGNPYPLHVSFIRDIASSKDFPNGLTQVSYTMNSISLVPIHLFKEIGLMDEMLFIDGVDSEWCWRAAYKRNCSFYLDKSVKITHHLGVGNRNIGKKEISLAAPYRMFYQYRNYLWLLRRSYIPRRWLCYNGFKYIIKMFYYPLFIKPRWKYFRFIMKGIIAGTKKQ